MKPSLHAGDALPLSANSEQASVEAIALLPTPSNHPIPAGRFDYYYLGITYHPQSKDLPAATGFGRILGYMHHATDMQ